MHKTKLETLFIAVCVSTLAIRAAAEDGEDPMEAERTRRGEFMKADLDRYTIVAVDRRETPLMIMNEPVLRFTNPVRESLSDGTVFLWLEGKRPLAAAVVSIREKGNAFRELVTFTNRTLECRREERIDWKPTSGNLVDQSLDDAAGPDASDKRRLRQSCRVGTAHHRIMVESWWAVPTLRSRRQWLHVLSRHRTAQRAERRGASLRLRHQSCRVGTAHHRVMVESVCDASCSDVRLERGDVFEPVSRGGKEQLRIA